jgi:uncharacterized cofD-like protein
MPANAQMTDIQKGRKRIENSKIIEAKIRSAIFLSYTLHLKRQIKKICYTSAMKNIVTVGGGTGSYTILLGLKDLPDVSLTALVSMADNGGSTGILRDELGVLPPGDVRQCLVALSEHSDIVRKLMNYRFDEGSLAGHSFGNIFLAALEKVTGDFVEGVEIASEILKVKGAVVPITKDQAELALMLRDGTVVDGQVNVGNVNLENSGLQKIYYKNNVRLSEKAKETLLKADYVVLGPGNYYCSIVPNLIVDGFKEIINQSKAKLILPINLTNKQEQTHNWKVGDYIKDMEKYLGKKVDFILVNNESPTKGQIENYKLEEGDGVLVQDDTEDSNDPRIIREPLLSPVLVTFNKRDAMQKHRSFIRHDSKKLAECIKKIIAQ